MIPHRTDMTSPVMIRRAGLRSAVTTRAPPSFGRPSGRDSRPDCDMEKIPRTMRAVVYRGANDLRLETVPVPRIRPDELLVRVAACGVCPTDIKKIQSGALPPPRIFGHETAGVIALAGARVRKFRVGERVALHHHVPCRDCHACRHRAFSQCSQYKRTGITAGFEPAHTVLKAINRLALLPGDHVLVIGQGPIGLLFTRLLSLEGVKVIATDLLATRLRMARQFGAVSVVRGAD